MHLLDIPSDILHAIFHELGVSDLEHVEQTCRAIAERDHTNLWRRHWIIAAPFYASSIMVGELPPVFPFVRGIASVTWTPDDDSLLLFYWQSLADMPRSLVNMHHVASVDSTGRRRKKRTCQFLVNRISELRRERLSYVHDNRLKQFTPTSLPIAETCTACGCKGPHLCGKIPASTHMYKMAIALHVTLSCEQLIRAITRSPRVGVNPLRAGRGA